MNIRSRATGLTGAGSQFLTQDTPGVGSAAEASDAFGAAVTAGDFDHDGFADLAIGVPGESSTIFAVGAVNVLYGTAAGLTGSGSQFVTQNTAGVGSSSEGSDGFGSVLAAGDLDSDGFADLAVGVPSESIGSTVDAGVVQLLYGTPTGLTGSGSQTFSQNSAGVSSGAERRDGFGDRLTTGDFDSDGFGDLAVGVPGEDSSLFDVGAVHVLYGTPTGVTGPGSQFFTQNSPGVRGTAEQYDLFGDALAAGDFDTDGFADLTVGASGQGIDDIEGGGAVHVLRGTPTGVTGSGSQYFTQNSPGMVGTAGQSDRFGAPLAANN